MHKENAALWKAKPLLTRLVGDNTWAPCGLMTAPDGRDELLFTDTVSFFNRPAPLVAGKAPSAQSISRGGTVPENTVLETANKAAGLDAPDAGAWPAGTEQHDGSHGGAAGGEALRDTDADKKSGETELAASHSTGNSGNDMQVDSNLPHGEEAKEGKHPAGETSHKALGLTGDQDLEMAEGTTVVRGNSSSANQQHLSLRVTAPQQPDGPASDADFPVEEHFIHPLFRLPPAARAERDLGLPEQEAEEVRRLLLLYVQKQEEICRGTRRLYEGLLRADRYRRTVWQWSKAEAHRGEMSDGEDWYDKEEWGLTEDLKKGEDEVEEDTAQTQKKTRNRK